ncbi:MAG: aminopeptidase, partial [Lentisphaeria bacterium]|nr:aminopeptidase [Lentisphaeria bacterium]
MKIQCMKNPQDLAGLNRSMDSLVGKICETYSDGNSINHNEGCNLPRESEILQILRGLLEIIFPGFGERVPQSEANLKYMVGEILYDCRAKLMDTVARALRYHCSSIHQENCNCMAAAAEAVDYLLESLPEIRMMVKQDIQAAFDGDPAARTLDEIVLSYPGVKALTIHRIAHCLYEKKVPLIPRMISEYAHRITGIDIHPGATIGKGVFIDHGTGVVIGETATLGSGVKLYQGVTLGALSFPKDACGKIIKGAKRHPTLEDNVTIYAGATILGDIVIGRGSVIGGNVWLTESVEPGTKISIAPPQLTILKPREKRLSPWDLLPPEKQNEMISNAERILSDSLGVKKNETLLLIYDRPTSNVGNAFIRAGEKLGLALTPRMIEVTSGNGEDPDPETVGMMAKHNVVIGATYYSLTHCNALRHVREKHFVRGVTLPGITDELFCKSMMVPVETLRESNRVWQKLLSGSHTIRVVTAAGTDVTFTSGKIAPVLVDDADNRELSCVGNIPAGETFLVPDPGSMEGVIAVDGSIGSQEWKAGCETAFITMRRGRAESFTSARGEALRETLGQAGERAFEAAEFGIGTNPALSLSGNLLGDEKVQGTIHIAFGNNASMGGDNDVPVH